MDASYDHTYDMILSIMENANLKQRRTFTLSPASLEYLEQEARQRSANSLSAVLDDLLQEKNAESGRWQPWKPILAPITIA